jgi:hypothetical protein
MTIDEAVKILTERLTIPFIGKNESTRKAVKLGIEALKAVQFWNHKQLPQFQIHLPGETDK